MKKAPLFVLFAVLVLLPLGIVSAAPASAPVSQEIAPDIFAIFEWLRQLAITAGTLTGFALLYSAVINAGKKLKPEWFPDSSAPSWNLTFQVVTLLTLVILQLTGRADLVPAFDQAAGLLANAIGSLLALGYGMWASRKGHEEILAGMPVIGKSYSNRIAGTMISVFEGESPVNYE
jgi:hypothetical protein